MRAQPTVIFFSPRGRPVPTSLAAWLSGQAYEVAQVRGREEIERAVLRSPPALVIIDADVAGPAGVELCRRLKDDPDTAIVPVAFVTGCHAPDDVRAWFEAGAAEVLTPVFAPSEQRARLGVLLARTERSVAVHPSTRLPGTMEIEREMRRRLDSGAAFAVCYADIDHFKEFNDRYSYQDGDRVIFLLSRMLREVVKGLCPSDGFVGHIGGDDFILVVPAERVDEVCSEALAVFDALMPYQYSDQDRQTGYYWAKDRRGQRHRIPLMTLSIGVVTTRYRRFDHPAQLSAVATELKAYAKTLPGSVFVVDRRRDAGERGPGARVGGSTE